MVEHIAQNQAAQEDPGRSRWPFSRFGVKLTALVVLLLVLLTFGAAQVITEILNDVLLQSMLARGSAIAHGIAGSAGYNIMANDRLALDNLAARAKASRGDLTYVVVMDLDRRVLAHSHLETHRKRFPPSDGVAVAILDGLTVTKTSRMGLASYEFELPISFANKHVGDVVVGVNAAAVTRSRIQAQKRISVVTLATLLFGIVATFLLSKLFTRPIVHLADGVARIRAGDYGVSIPVTSRDELGELSRDFNAMANRIREQREDIRSYAENLEQSYGDIVRILTAALDARDNYTYGHSARVAKLSRIVGRNLGMSENSLKDLEMACLLHDVGKIHVPDSILKKQGPLDEGEYQQIKEHAIYGSQILQLADSLHKYIPAVRHHHESYDGQGYPDQLAGGDIPLSAQILAIADAYDAMTSSRPYRERRSREDAVTEIRAGKGRQFEPSLADTFIASLDEYEAARDELRFDGQT